MNKPFFGGSDVDLLTSLVESFIYQENEEPDSIYVTHLMLLYGSTVAYVSTNHFCKADLLDAFNDWVEKDSFLSSIGLSEDEFIALPITAMLCNCVWYYGWDEFGTDYHPYTLDEWYELRKESLDFYLSDLKEYLKETYGIDY